MEAGSTMRSVRYAVAAECLPAAPLLRETGAAQSPKPKLLDRVRHAVRARHYSRRTEKAYVHWVKRYIFFHGKRHPADGRRLGHRDVSTTMIYTHVLNRGPAAVRSPADRMFPS